MKRELRKGAKRLGIELSDSMIEKFIVYQRELLEWNKKMNLVSSRDETRLIKRHFLDSLEPTKFIPDGARVLDIGSGAGFPGVPIKIIRDDIHLDLLEPKLKRFNFLNHLVKTLNLSIGIYRERVEDFSNSKVYDIVLSRSVGKLKWLTPVALSVLSPDGKIVTYKGSRFWDEFKEIDGWKIFYRKSRKFCDGTIVVLKRKNRPR